MKTYRIRREGKERELGRVWVAVCEGEAHKHLYELHPQASQAIRNHSPDGFEFGYCGSGPAQLALAILLDFTGNKDIAQRNYQRFKERYIAVIGHLGGDITGEQIQKFLSYAKNFGT